LAPGNRKGNLVSDFKTLDIATLEEAAEERMPLEGYDLSGVMWNGLDFLDLELKGCRSGDTKFQGCDLEGLKAEDCDFVGASFASTNLREASFRKCQFTDREKHEGVLFRYVKLVNARFENCDASFSKFDHCELYDLGLKDCNFRAVDFAGSEFSRQLSKTRALVLLEVVETNLDSANLFCLNLEGVKFEKSTLRGAILSESNLSSALLLDCNLNDVDWRQADLTGANLGGSNIEGLDLRTLRAFDGLVIGEAQGTILLDQMGVSII
jgi:uncharacterized protein YjbI with pentapeptide repeats